MATGGEYELGYDDNRLEVVISDSFRCPICFLVLKDPVMCRNEHCFCSSCIKEHLKNCAFCPTCRVHLGVDSLYRPSRIVIDYLSELRIRCDFHDRGCREMVQVSDLKRHVASCGFSPVQCSNEGCNVLVNKRDKLHHEDEACDFRRSKCHDCGQLKKEMKKMKVEMLVCQDQMKNEMKIMKDEMLIRQDQMKNEMRSEVKALKDEMKEQMKEEVNDLKIRMKNEMKEIVLNAVRDVMARIRNLEVEIKSPKQSLSSLATCSSSDARENIIVAGGWYIYSLIMTSYVKSTECFNWVDETWTRLISAEFEGRSDSCSFLFQGQMMVAGGDDGKKHTDSMKCLNVADPAATWKDFAVNLPVKCHCHKVVNYNDRLIMSGGWVQVTDRGSFTCSNVVYEVQLVPPHSSMMLTRLPQPRSDHGMELFDQKLFILGGSDGKNATNSVVQYDLVKNECNEMPSLPDAVCRMATVLWRNNVLLLGGENSHHVILDSMIMYDVITGRSQILPCMKRKRRCCTAVLTGNVVVVMGGQDEKNNYLKSVECFDLVRQVWQDLPDMLEPRVSATAVVKPNQ